MKHWLPLGEKLIVGNWKMNKRIEEANQFLDLWSAELVPPGVRVGLAVPFTLLAPLAERMQRAHILVGAQNMCQASSGSFTGEIAAKMLKDLHVQFVILGHSERRRLYHENDQMIAEKVQLALEEGIIPILCVGETDGPEEGNGHEVELQLRAVCQTISAEKSAQLVVAYEPLWAIGRGVSATEEQIAAAVAVCRRVLEETLGEEAARAVPILYGGSVDERNAPSLLESSGLSGLLVGGSSLSLDSFQKIVKNALLRIF